MIVKVSRFCHCVGRFNFDKEFEFDTKEEALQKAKEIIEKLKKDSCLTHKYSIVEKDNLIEIFQETNFGNNPY